MVLPAVQEEVVLLLRNEALNKALLAGLEILIYLKVGNQTSRCIQCMTTTLAWICIPTL